MRTQACSLILAFQAIFICEAAKTRSFLQPDAASRLFHQVAAKWVQESKSSLKDSKVDAEQLSQMKSSCSKVTEAFVAAAKGDRNKAVEYMGNVCTEADDDLCKEFGRRLADQVEVSTDQANMDSFCESFWRGPLKDKAMGRVIQSPVSSGSNSSSPLKDLHHTQSKPAEHGYSKKDSTDGIHAEAERIAAEGAAKLSQAHPRSSKVHVAEKEQVRKVLKLDKDVEKKVKNATDTALKAAKGRIATQPGKQKAQASKKVATKGDKSESSKSVAASSKTRLGSKKPKALVTSGMTTGTMVSDEDLKLQRAVDAVGMQALKTAAAAAAAKKAAAEDAATESKSNGATSIAKAKTADAELEKVAQEAEDEAQRTAEAAATAEKAANEEAKVAQTTQKL